MSTMTGTLSKVALLTKAMTGTPSDVLLTKAMPGNTLLTGTPSDAAARARPHARTRAR